MWGLTYQGLPPVFENPRDELLVQRSICALPQAYHVSHLKVVTPLVWQSMMYKHVGKLLEDVLDLPCQGLTYVPPDVATHLLVHTYLNIAAAIQTLFPLLEGQVSSYKEVLSWIHFTYTGYWVGACAAPYSTVLIQFVVAEGGPLFTPVLQNFCQLYPRSCTSPTTSTLGPFKPDCVS